VINAVDLSKTPLISVARVLCQWSTEMNTPVIHSFYSQLIGLLPAFCQTVGKLKKEHFTRSRKLPLSRLIVTLLHLTASGSHHEGVDIKLSGFFNLSRRGGLWPEAQTSHRSALKEYLLFKVQLPLP
jgi:hypothetical protein